MTAIDVGVDIGTTHLKFAAVDEGGGIIASVALSPGWQHPQPRWTQLEPDRLFADVLAGLGQLADKIAVLDRAARFRSLGVTGMAESGVLLDPRGESAFPIIAWHDPRGRELLEQVPASLRRDFAGATGLPVSDLATLFKLKWMQCHGVSLLGKQWLSVPEYVAFRLGARRASEASLAGRTGLIELAQGRPWPPALEWLGVDARFLPDSSCAGEALGSVAGEGVPASLIGASITVAGHDHSVAAVAGGAESGDLFATMGTAETIVMTLAELPSSPVVAQLVEAGLEVNPHVLPDRYAVVTGTRTGLVLNRVLRLVGIADKAALDALDERARAAPDDGPSVVDSIRIEGDVLTFSLDGDGLTPESLWSAAVAQCAKRIGERVELVRRLTGWDGERAVLTGGWSDVASMVRARQRWAQSVTVSPLIQLELLGAASLARQAAARATEIPTR